MNLLQAEALRRRAAGQTVRYIAHVLRMDRREVRRLTRPLNRRGRPYARHSRSGKA